MQGHSIAINYNRSVSHGFVILLQLSLTLLSPEKQNVFKASAVLLCVLIEWFVLLFDVVRMLVVDMDEGPLDIG